MIKNYLVASIIMGLISAHWGEAATPVQGDSLEITGASNYYYSNSEACGIIGYSNSLYNVHDSFIVGTYNFLDSGTNNSVVIGEDNDGYSVDNSVLIGKDNSGYSMNNSLIVGKSTSADNQFINSLVVGDYNGGGSSSNQGDLTNSLVTGDFNLCDVRSGLVAGTNNFANGQQFVLGKGLLATNNSSLMVVVGKYNASPVSGQLFVIGNGTSQTRTNALEVYENGKIKIPRQGDVGMGRFGYTADQ